jgi:hypothetical protein
MDIDPMRRNMTMKNVAGFHSFDLAFFFNTAIGELPRRGLGMRLTQKDVWAMFVEA